MTYKKTYLSYGIFLALAGLIGFFLTGAKSALMSGASSGAIMAALSFFVDKNKIVGIVAKVLNVMFTFTFAWRFWLALSAVLGGNMAKLIPAILLGLMAFVSLGVIKTTILNKS